MKKQKKTHHEKYHDVSIEDGYMVIDGINTGIRPDGSYDGHLFKKSNSKLDL